jgi:hypothetical protein
MGGNRGWLAVGALIWGRGIIKRTFGKQEQVLTVEKLTKGQGLRIDAIGPPSRRQRAAARRADRRVM